MVIIGGPLLTSNGNYSIIVFRLMEKDMDLQDTFKEHYPEEHVGVWKHNDSPMNQYIVLDDKEVRLIIMCDRIVKAGSDSAAWYKQLHTSLTERTGLDLRKDFDLINLIGPSFDRLKEI